MRLSSLKVVRISKYIYRKREMCGLSKVKASRGVLAQFFNSKNKSQQQFLKCIDSCWTTNHPFPVIRSIPNW
jgi:hypothetical protein